MRKKSDQERKDRKTGIKTEREREKEGGKYFMVNRPFRERL